jgi:subtilisin family serine protease
MSEDNEVNEVNEDNKDNWFRKSDIETRTTSEAEYIVSQFRLQKKSTAIGYVRGEDGGIAYMFVKGRFLTREQYLGGPPPPGAEGIKRPRGIFDVLRDAHLDLDLQAIDVRRVIGDVLLLTIPGASDVSNDNPLSVPSLLERFDAELGIGVATPDHVLTVSGVMGPCPATEPQEVYGPWRPYPVECRGDGGAGVRIYVADTGLIAGAKDTFPWLEDVDGELDPRSGPGNAIGHYDGHGTFVAGVLRCVAPKAKIYVANVFDIAGSMVESDIGLKLGSALAHGDEIIHLTIASPSRKNVPMMAVEAWLKHLLPAYKGVVCIAAAGNNGNQLPCWPGAFPEVISVGALATDWRSRAYFSNFGSWVDVYAPGQDLINAFGSGKYKCVIAPYTGEERRFYGMAQWSGTSFSTPIVTGLIAARMSRSGESAQEAAAALLAEARAQAIPGVGPVLFPYCDDDLPRRGRRGHGCGCGHGCGYGHDCGCGHDGGCGHGKHGLMPR